MRMVGVKTNIVTSVEDSPGNINDYHLLAPLLASTARRFDMARLSADKGYSGRSNVAAISAAGVVPLVAFKYNAKAGPPGPWRDSFDSFRNDPHGFYRAYHQRSNVETTFSMIKAKFGGFVRSKTASAQRNEVLCKVLAHNLCVLVQAFFEHGVEPRFWDNGTSALSEPYTRRGRRIFLTVRLGPAHGRGGASLATSTPGGGAAPVSGAMKIRLGVGSSRSLRRRLRRLKFRPCGPIAPDPFHAYTEYHVR
jgi:DDE family transposase